MAGRKQLKTIAGGLLGTFTSRNNDINGYWGLGVLRLYAQRRGLETLEIELLSRHYNEPAVSPFFAAGQYYRQWFSRALLHWRLSENELRSAYIRLRFSTFEEFPDVVRDTQGKPYVCTVSITTPQGTEYSASKVGVCAPCDPKIDRRSTRICVSEEVF